jgi:hypothetical protein
VHINYNEHGTHPQLRERERLPRKCQRCKQYFIGWFPQVIIRQSFKNPEAMYQFTQRWKKINNPQEKNNNLFNCGTIYCIKFFPSQEKIKVNQPIPAFRQGNPNGGICTPSAGFKGVHVSTSCLGLKSSPDVSTSSTIRGSGLDENDAWLVARFTSVGGGTRLGGDPDKSGSESRK